VNPAVHWGSEPVVHPTSDLLSDLPLTLYNIDTTGVVSERKYVSTSKKEQGDFRDSKEVLQGPHPIESPPSLEAQCYAEAREIPHPEHSAGVVAKALKIDCWDAAEALEIIREVKANGGDSGELAYALWIPE
jgi:hypothetical protein